MNNKFILAEKLFDIFFYNKKAYAIQEEINGEINFITKHQRIDINKLYYYLENKVAVLSYQQNFDKLAWICLDFDIKKNFLKGSNNAYNFVTDTIYRPLLFEDVQLAIDYLKDNEIEYILEYSGNRGMHIWILFDSVVTKQIGFSILDKIYNTIPFKYAHNIDSPIGIDLFPKVAEAKNNKVGKGVKIPVSYHLKSKRYSYIIGKELNNIIEVDNLSDEFINNQIKLLSNIRRNNAQDLMKKFEITQVKQSLIFERQIAKITNNISLESICNMLNKSIYYRRIFSKPISSWSEEERKVVVAALVRIKSDTDINYGKRLLKELFSKGEDFDEEKTNNKIEKLKNLYPPTIEYLKHLFKTDCEFCISNNISNALQLLEGIEINTQDDLDSTIKWAINSEKRYLVQNDEVPLNFIYDELARISVDSIRNEVKDVLKGQFLAKPSFNEYIRYESEEKVRKLYGMSARDRIITTVLMKYIYDIIGTDIISPISYSYRINTELTNDIFVNWNQLWLDFVKEIRDCIDHKGYENHYVIRLDVKSFYDEINLTLLRQILHGKANNNINNIYIKMIFNQLNPETREKYINACNYLIDVCKAFGEKGVPQGPAFARFLAEIYLSALDNYILTYIDDKCDFVCRYVDDYYIFFKDNEKGEKVKEALGQELEKIYLSINSDKFKFGKLVNLKDRILEKNQFEKYFIDGIDSTTPNAVLETAVTILNDMFVNMDTSEDVKDLPFFLTHMVDEKYKIKKAPYIIKKITLSSIGRGSMFKHFYKNIAFQHSDLGFYKDIRGLSRSNFINQLQRNQDVVGREKLTEIVQHYVSIDLYKYEKIELLRLIFLAGLDVDISNIIKNEYRIIFDVLFSIESVYWKDKNLIEVLSKIEDNEDKTQSINLLSHILSISRNLPIRDEIENIIYSILSTHSYDLPVDSVQIIFDLTCYFTLYNTSQPRIMELWCRVIEKIDSDKVENISTMSWYKYNDSIACKNIYDKNVLFILTLVLGGYSIRNNDNAAKNIETEFALSLIHFLYEGENFSFVVTEELKDFIKKKAIIENNKLLLWLCDGAEYLIDRKRALKNIQLNERMVLKKGKNLLVYGRKEILFSSEDIFQEAWGEYKFDKYYTIYEIDQTLSDFTAKLRGKSLIEALRICGRLIKQMDSEGLVNIFEKGTLTEANDSIKFKYSQFDKEFILNQSESIRNIQTELYFKMFETLENSTLESYQLEFDLELLANSLFKEIVPQHKVFNKTNLIQYKERVIFYLKEFIKNIDSILSKHTKFGCYQLEQIKIDCILSFIKKYKNELPTTYDNWKDSLIALDIYNGYYNKEIEKFILYKKVDVKYSNLEELINSITSSICGNLRFAMIDDFLDSIRTSLTNLETKISSSREFIRIKPLFDKENGEVKINDNVYNFNDLKCLKLFEGNELHILNDELAFYIESNQFVFFIMTFCLPFHDLLIK